MRTEERLIKERIIIKHICDICGEQTHKSCRICGKDICRDHRIADDRDQSDYPDFYCIPCWEIGKEYRQQQKEIEDKADRKYVEIEEQWKEEALLIKESFLNY